MKPHTIYEKKMLLEDVFQYMKEESWALRNKETTTKCN